MTSRKKINLFIVVLFVVLVGLYRFCYGIYYCDANNCGFGPDCPGKCPPCYKVTIGDLIPCYEGAWLINGTWFLKNLGGCFYERNADDESYWYYIDLTVIADSNTTLYACDSMRCFYCKSCSADGVGDCNNEMSENYCQAATYPDFYGGWGSWEPIWDCNECNNCDTLDIDVSDYKDPNYAREDCCPPGEKGDSTSPIFTCAQAKYVVPVYTIWEYNPNASDKWKEVKSSTLVKVTPDPNQCAESQSVRFLVQALKGGQAAC